MVATFEKCPTCDGKVQATGHGKQRLCADCQVVYQSALARCAAPPGTSGPCQKCKQPAGAPGTLIVDGGTYCPDCRRPAELLVRLQVKGLRRSAGGASRHTGRALPRWVVLTTLGLAAGASGGVFAYCVSKWVDERTPKPDMAQIEFNPESPATQAYERALRASQAGMRTYAEAVKVEAAIAAETEAVAEDPRLAKALKALLEEVREAKLRTAPALGAGKLWEASVRLAADGKWAEAVELLAGFPPEFFETPAGEQVALARARYAARAECEVRARDALSASASSREQRISQLLGSDEAKRCAFAATELGQRLASEMRRLENQRVLAEAKAGKKGGPKKKVVPPEQLIKQARALEAKGRLTRAEALYVRALKEDPFSAQGAVGRARVALLREQFLTFRSAAQKAGRLAPSEANVVLAWLAHLQGEGSPVELLGRASSRDPLARSLKAILSLKEPTRSEGDQVRLYSRGLSPRQVERAWLVLTDCAGRAARSLRLADGASGLDVFLFADSKARQAFLKSLGQTPSKSGVLRGCFAVAPSSLDDGALRQAVGDSLARRSTRAPAWLVVALPAALAGEQGRAQMPLEQLEKLSGRKVWEDPKARETAMAYAGLARTESGSEALASYLLRRRSDRRKAWLELEKQRTSAPR